MEFIEIVKKCIQADVSMALYRLPNDTVIYLVVDKNKAKSINFRDLSESVEGFVFHPYNRDNNPIWFINSDFVISSDDMEQSEEFNSFINNLHISDKQSDELQQDQSKQDYLQVVNDLINKLNETDLQKAVYSRIKTVDNSGIDDVVDVFTKMEMEYEEAFVFFVNIGDTLSWIGASPELLLSMNSHCMQTMALAGTQVCVDSDIIDIEWGSKERREQQYVCEFIEEKLTLIDSEFEKGQTKTVKAGNICHIQTPYYISSDDDIYWQIVSNLHPTPAVCGLPANDAFEEIGKIEKYDRGYYAGFLGPLNIFSNTSMFVNLRCARVFKSKMQLYVGGGITADSVAHKEWDETESKAQTIINILCNE